jgi:hypothetical protein
MGDVVFFIPPILESLKRHYPDSHITFVTAWGFKNKRGVWGKRNQDGHCLALLMTNPHINQLVHWHDTKLSLEGNICIEEGKHFPTWNTQYFEQQKKSGDYQLVAELDCGIPPDKNPMPILYQLVGLPEENYTNYKLYLTPSDLEVASYIIAKAPHPRIVLLEGIENQNTRGWDPSKIPHLTSAIKKKYHVNPIWFGSRHIPEFQGRPLTLKENIATLTYCNVGIGVMAGATHFAAAVGLPTLTLFADMPLERGAPAYFLNSYIKNSKSWHRTLLGPNLPPWYLLKGNSPPPQLTPPETSSQKFKQWLLPGRQSTKSAIAVLTVDEVMSVLAEMV